MLVNKLMLNCYIIKCFKRCELTNFHTHVEWKFPNYCMDLCLYMIADCHFKM